MKSRTLGVACIVAITLATCGCNSTKNYKTLTLAEAICEVQDAIVATRREPGSAQAGLLPAEVTVTLHLAAKETSSSSVGVVIPNGVTTWTLGSSRASEGSQSNTMAIKFIPAALAPTTTALGEAIARQEFPPEAVMGPGSGLNTHSHDQTRELLKQFQADGAKKEAEAQSTKTVSCKQFAEPTAQSKKG